MKLKIMLIFCFVFIMTFLPASVSNLQQDMNEDTCSRDTCSKTGVNVEQDENVKHRTDHDELDVVDNIDNVRIDPNINTNSEESENVKINPNIDTNNEEFVAEERQDEGVKFVNYEFPPLTRIDPGKVGDVVDIELEEGKIYKRITRSVNPPIFEIPNYLSLIESNRIISAALDAGLERSGVVGSDIDEERNQVNDLSEMSRVSEQTWVSSRNMPTALWDRLLKRLSKLTQLPLELLDLSEEMQVVSYVRGGHYHTHIDSTDTKNRLHLPCCFQTPECLEVEITNEEYEECCRICRYVTVLYYLDDVEEGGQTAFPLADMSDDLLKEKMPNREFQAWHDLSHYCHNASVVVNPKRGSAVMWYNHLLDQNGYLGHVDIRSNHGGCDIIKGTKWIANNWISATKYKDRTKPTMIY